MCMPCLLVGVVKGVEGGVVEVWLHGVECGFWCGERVWLIKDLVIQR